MNHVRTVIRHVTRVSVVRAEDALVADDMAYIYTRRSPFRAPPTMHRRRRSRVWGSDGEPITGVWGGALSMVRSISPGTETVAGNTVEENSSVFSLIRMR